MVTIIRNTHSYGRILYQSVYISHDADTFRKGMNPIILLTMSKIVGQL